MTNFHEPEIRIVPLAKHRFSSHVLQTLFEAGAKTVDRETREVFPAAQSLPQFAGQPLLNKLVLNACDVRISLIPSIFL